MKRILLLSFALITLISYGVMAQRTVSGKVTDEAGESLPGVNVVIKGTTTGTTSDLDGNYRLQVEDGATLVFSFVGFETQEVEVGARSTIDLAMGGATELQEVVVTAAGIEQNKRTIGYAVQNIDADDIKNAQETNLVNALNGKVAGVTVVSSAGTPGASSSIRIRGNTSISGSNNPLFVVDGVPIDNSEFGNGVDGVSRSNRAIDLNPNDIESMTVLKGAAATVLYGIRAANGAIIINTKKGKEGSMRVTLNSSVRMDQVNKLPPLQDTYAQGRSAGGVLTYRGPETGEGNSWGPRISDLEFDGDETYPYDVNGALVPAGTGNGVPARAYDNLDNFFVNGFTYDNNLSVSGGNSRVTYFFSVGHLSQDGIIPNSTFDRTSFRVTTSAKLTDKLTVGMSANYINSGGQRVQQGSNTSGIMLGLLRNTPTFDAANGYTDGNDAADDPSVYEFPDGTQRSYRGGVYDSPFWVVNNNPFEDDVNRIIGYTSLEYQILDWLSVSYKAGIDRYTEVVNTAFNINSATLSAGQVNQFTRTGRDFNSDFLIKINKNISDLAISAVLGHNYYSTEVGLQQTLGETLSVPKFYQIGNATDIQGFRDITRRKLAGVFGQINFDWKDQVYLNVSGRNDWSSILPEDNNSVFYPAVSAGWNFTNTLDIAGDVFTNGKIRASWAQVGNDGGNAFVYATDPYFAVAGYGGDGFMSTITKNFPAFGINAFDRNNLLPNSNLKPELTTTIEVGADLDLFNNRLGFDVTYYDTETTDAIIAVDVAPSSGYNSAVQNVATISNTGWEVVLEGTPIVTNKFRWDLTVNFTQYENVVEELAPGIETVSLAGFVSTTSRAVAGEPYGAIYGSGFQRTDDGQLIMGADGWPLEVDEDFVLGDPNPDWVAGIRSDMSYGGFSFGMLWDIRQGGDMWNGTYGVIKTFGMAEVTAAQREVKGYIFDGVQQTGTDGDGNPVYSPNTTPVDFYNPRFPISQNKWNRYAFGGLPEENIQETSWVRLREVSLGYTFEKSFLSKFGIDNLSLTAVGRNLLLFTEYNGIDPETNLTGTSNGFGLDYFNNPNTRSYALTLSATF